jgi:hypothetical protein
MQTELSGEQAAFLWPAVYVTVSRGRPVTTKEVVLISAVAKLVERAAHSIAEEADRILAQAGVECNITVLQGGQDVQS